jgi:hypothetical protein
VSIESRQPSPDAEIHRADPKYVRVAAVVVVTMLVAGAALLLWVQFTIQSLTDLRSTDPEEAWRRMLGLGRVLSAGAGGMLVVMAAWLVQLGVRIRTEERFPLPNARVLKDTVILRGDAARKYGRTAITLGAALGLGGIALYALITLLLSRLS